MEKSLSIAALLIATLALLFGGYFSASWTKELSKPALSVDVRDVWYEDATASEERLIDIPPELRDRTRRAKYVPTLAQSEPREEIEDLLQMASVHSVAVQALGIAEKEMSSGGPEVDAAKIWNDIPVESRSLLFTYRTSRIADELVRTGDEDLFEISEVVDSLVEGVDPGNPVLEGPAVARALQLSAQLISDLNARPTAERIIEVIQADVDVLELAAAEHESFRGELEKLLKAHEDAADEEGPQSTAWKVTATVYNAGAAAESVIAIGALSIQRQPGWDGDNHVLILEGDRMTDRIVVSPGEAFTVELGVTRNRDRLEAWFEDGDKDFVLSMPLYSGGYVTSGPHKFSRRDIVGTVRTDLAKYAKVAVP